LRLDLGSFLGVQEQIQLHLGATTLLGFWIKGTILVALHSTLYIPSAHSSPHTWIVKGK